MNSFLTMSIGGCVRARLGPDDATSEALPRHRHSLASSGIGRACVATRPQSASAIASAYSAAATSARISIFRRTGLVREVSMRARSCVGWTARWFGIVEAARGHMYTRHHCDTAALRIAQGSLEITCGDWQSIVCCIPFIISNKVLSDGYM